MKIDIFSTREKINICLDIAISLLYLHSRKPKVLHRDLKSANCLVDKNNKIKLCDFGLSKTINGNSNRNYLTKSISTFQWMAPEYLQKGIFTEKSDIYSLGILFWEIFSKDTTPYKNVEENYFLLGEIFPKKYPKRPEFSVNIHPEIRQLIEICWEEDPDKRPEIETIVGILKGFLSSKYNFS